MKQQHFWFVIEDEGDWHIDERTKTVGRQGIAQARATLESCRSVETLDSAA